MKIHRANIRYQIYSPSGVKCGVFMDVQEAIARAERLNERNPIGGYCVVKEETVHITKARK